jgi:hypothetical protein
MSEKESSEYGFMATLDGTRLVVSDSNGGGDRFYAGSRSEAVGAIERYIQRCAHIFADCMADDLFDEDDDSDPEDDEG